MSVERTIEIESISFVNEDSGHGMERVAVVTWRIATPGSRQEFTVPIRIIVTPEYPETEVVKFARASFHVLMASLANQTTPWRVAAES